MKEILAQIAEDTLFLEDLNEEEEKDISNILKNIKSRRDVLRIKYYAQEGLKICLEKTDLKNYNRFAVLDSLMGRLLEQKLCN